MRQRREGERRVDSWPCSQGGAALEGLGTGETGCGDVGGRGRCHVLGRAGLPPAEAPWCPVDKNPGPGGIVELKLRVHGQVHLGPHTSRKTCWDQQEIWH